MENGGMTMHIANVFFIIIIVFLLLVAVGKFTAIHSPVVKVPEALFIDAVQAVTSRVPALNNTLGVSNQTFNQVIVVPRIGQSVLANYTLGLINRDREANGLNPVSLSTEPSGQEYAESMLEGDYFSHWDAHGMKPYMRYTLLGGTGAVSENIAYVSSEYCAVAVCTGDINPNQSLAYMENNMMNNDSVCCQNGHRDNILDPNHNQVSIGVAYNNSKIYLVEDFIDNYISWVGNTPAYTSMGEVYLEGQIAAGYNLTEISVDYDAPLQNLTPATVPDGPYGYGQQIAGVVSSPLYYYPNLTTIVADSYSTPGGRMGVTFSMKSLIRKYGAGEYTVALFLSSNQTKSTFVGSTYTIFINSSGGRYIPTYV